MEETEFRFCELRAAPDKRMLTGVAVKYGDVANIGTFRERFEAGAFGDLSTADVLLNAQHQRVVPLARTGGGGLVLFDTLMELRIDATLPETRAADDTLSLVRSKVLRGLSIEFKALQERMESGVRVITRAILKGVAVVDSGAYQMSTVAARQAQDDMRRLRRRWW